MKNEFVKAMEEELKRLNTLVKADVVRRKQLFEVEPRTTEIELELRDMGTRLTKINYARTTIRQAIATYKKYM